MGDAEADVQKALAWAYRALAQLAPDTTEGALREQASLAATAADGNRAWVIRESLSKLDPSFADSLRSSLTGIRKRPGAPATSPASATSARFGELPDPATHPDPPLTDSTGVPRP